MCFLWLSPECLKFTWKKKKKNMPTKFSTVITLNLPFLKIIIICKLSPYLHNLCIYLNFYLVIWCIKSKFNKKISICPQILGKIDITFLMIWPLFLKWWLFEFWWYWNYDNSFMSIILDTRTQNTMKSGQYNGRQDPGGHKDCYKRRPKLVP